MTDKLSHLDEEGRVNMVDVGSKPVQERIAKATGKIFINQKTISSIREKVMKKGDVLTVAEIAGIQAAKNTASLWWMLAANQFRKELRRPQVKYL